MSGGSPPASIRAELESLFDPRFLAHRTRDLELAWRTRDERLARAAGGAACILEIGCHKGTVLRGLRDVYPEHEIVGIEWNHARARTAANRMEVLPERPPTVLAGDARILVPIIFPPESIDAAFVLFPDPWWKKRHHKRRLLEPMFLRVLARRLRPGGRLYVKSDVVDYLHRLRAFALASRAFEPLPSDDWPTEVGWPLSQRERKCRDVALPFARGFYRRRADFDATLPTRREDPAAFEVDEDFDPQDWIRGPALADRIARNASDENS